jgi:hypothetical protein
MFAGLYAGIMKNDNHYHFGLSQIQRLALTWLSVVAVVSMTLLSPGVLCAADDAQAQKLLAEAKEKELQAQKLRTDANSKLQEAADEEVAAGDNQREARILTARALQLMKADPNKLRAFQLRHEAQMLWGDAHRQLIAGRNAEQRAAQRKRNSDELLKAAAQLKDQPNIAAGLENDAKAQATEAQNLEQAATNDKAEGEAFERRAEAAWAQAEKLDPETTRQLAPKPTKPEVHAPAQHAH